MSACAANISNALLHSVWQIALIAIAYKCVLVATCSAQLRYKLGCFAMVLAIALPLGWFLLASQPIGTVARSKSDRTRDLTNLVATGFVPPRKPDIAAGPIAGVFELTARAQAGCDGVDGDGERALSLPSPNGAWLTIAWLVGVCVVGLRIPLGFHAASRLKCSSCAVPAHVLSTVEKLCNQLSIRSRVLVAQSERVVVPCVVGFAKPTILLPVSLLSGLTVGELEAILAHELAHIRRHDFLFNLVQSIIETLLFFHPAVWWISRCVREERENCCDDLALKVCSDRRIYASALLALGEAPTQLAIAANGGSLFKRLQRVLGQSPRGAGRASTVALVGAAIALLAVVVVLATIGRGSWRNSNNRISRSAEMSKQKSASKDAPRRPLEATPAGICEAARAGNVQAIDRILAADPALLVVDNPHNWTKTVANHAVSDSYNKKPVEVAAFFNQPKAVVALLKASRDSAMVDSPIDGYFNSLRIARVMGNDHVIKAIETDILAKIEAHPELLRDTGERRDTLLFYAAQQGDMALVQMLLDRGADATPLSNIGHTVIQTVLDGSKDEHRREIAKLLVERGAPVTLWVATAMEDIGRVKAMLAEDPNLAKEKWEWSECYPLVRACELGNREIIELLLDHGADINAVIGGENPSEFGMPIMKAYLAGHYEIVNLLLDRDASIHAHPNCDTPLIDSIYRAALKANREAVTRGEIPTNADEILKLYKRLTSLGGEPYLYSHVEAKNYPEIERQLKAKPEAVAHNYGRGPGTVFSSISHAAAWLGDAKAMELCLTLASEQQTSERANENLRDAVCSHNRDGAYSDYRRIIEMNLKWLKQNDAPITIGPLHLLAKKFLHNYRYSANTDLPVMEEMLDLAALFIEYGAEIDHRDPESDHTALSQAVVGGHVEYVVFLLDRGASTNQNDPPETRPLLLAEERGFREIAKLIRGRMNTWQLFGWQDAIERDDVVAATQLLERDQTFVRQCVQKFRKDGTWFLVDPLCEAARRNCEPMARLLMNYERDPNVTFGQGQWNGEVPGAYCLAWAGSEEMRQFLVLNGADPNSIDGIDVPNLDDETVSMEETNNDLGMQWQLAIESRDEDQVRELLTAHPHLSQQVIMDRWRDGRMGHRSLDPLYQVAQSGHLGIVRQMIESGYDKSKLRGAFELAAPEVAAYLLEQGVDAEPNVGLMCYIAKHDAVKFWLDRGYEIRVPMLHDACCGRGRLRGHKHDGRKGWEESFRATARILIEAGADVNARMAGGNKKYDGCQPWKTNRETPLHFAAGNWDPQLVQMLLDAGADKTLTNDLGETPYDWAVKFKAPKETLSLLANEVTSTGKSEEENQVMNTTRLDFDSCPENCSPEAWRLFCASANGDLETVKRIVRDRPARMHEFIWYECPLFYAVRENQVEVVRVLLDAGINPAYSNFTYSSWQKLLPIAKDRGFDEVHSMLVAEMQLRFNYSQDYEPLWQAIVAGDLEDVKQRIAANPQLANIGDEHGNRAIHWAILARRIPIIQSLLDAGADINAKRADMQSPLHLALDGDYWFDRTKACEETSAQEVADFIRNNGADYEFCVAVAYNDLDHVKAELSKRPELAKQLNEARRTPLHFASVRGHLDMVHLLLDHGADPNLPEHCAAHGRALFEASARNDIPMMKLLLERGANADAYVDSSGNCLSIAEQGGEREAEALELLKEYGAKPGEWTLNSGEKVSAALDDDSFVPNRDMWSSVLGQIISDDKVELLDKYVARFGTGDIRRLNPSNGWRIPRSREMLDKLLEHGADLNARDWYGRTFLHHSATYETPAVAEFLVEAGIDLNAIDHQSGTTAIGLAAWNGGLAMVDFLLKAGANAKLPTDASWAQPLTFAKAQGHDEVVKRLQQG